MTCCFCFADTTLSHNWTTAVSLPAMPRGILQLDDARFQCVQRDLYIWNCKAAECKKGWFATMVASHMVFNTKTNLLVRESWVVGRGKQKCNAPSPNSTDGRSTRYTVSDFIKPSKKTSV
jgi:hypothetical protein